MGAVSESIFCDRRIGTCTLLALSGALTSAPPAVFAQPPQIVEVTGSRILRPELSGNTPAIAVDLETLGNLGFENFADMATQLPQFAAGFGASRTQSATSSPMSSGLNLVNLRNLGFARALVLINGRRTVGGTSTTTAVDFNTMPTSNIERIDIITGGASAVYGSDAVAGVINIITKKNFDGFEVGAGYGQAQRGDNRNPTGHVMWGRSFGNSGRVLATLQLDRQGQVSCRDRELCSEDFFWGTPANPLRGPPAYSDVGVGGRFFVGSNSYTRRNDSFVAGGQLIPFSLAIDGYNRNPERDLAIPTRRTMGALDAEFVITPSIRAYGELNYGKTETTAHLESIGFQSQAQGSMFGTLQATIPVGNPFIPAPLLAAVNAFNANAQPAQRIAALTWWQRLNTVGGPRGATNERETTRIALGVKGDSTLFDQPWRWDLYHVDGRTDTTLRANGLVSTSNLYHGLRVEPDPAPAGRWRCVDAAARAAGCVPINPFADYTAEMQEALRVDAISTGTGRLSNTVGTVSGTLAELPAGSLRAAAGLERRRISGFLDIASVSNQALATGTPIADTDKSTITTREAFVEALVPVLADRPGIRSLNLEAAFRRSEADRSGYDTWKIGGDWEPAPGLRLRAMRARAVRAPEPRDLSGGGAIPAALINDPCTAARRNASPIRATNCAADGVPANYAPPAGVQQGVTGRFPSNPDLAPEVATTLTLGLVWQPAQIEGLIVAVDRFKIDVQGVIAPLARQIAVDRCYDTAERQFCGSIVRGSHPLVPGATYVLVGVNQRVENIAMQSIAGVDVDIRVRWKTDFGQLDAGVLFTHYDQAILVPIAGSTPVDLLGPAGGAPNGWIRKTAAANVGWKVGNFRAHWNIRYIGDADMAVGTTAQGFPRIPAMVYHNVRAGVAFAKGGEVFFGITNVGDRTPPLFASGTVGTGDTVPGYYDVFGRSFFAGVKVRFW
ncbi:TonB-dependent receptor [Aquincola sp. S2]|uniref:TonB-dependent receptor n=1 Tax=Pseudaquabacterium terrae TaxID=2732868 RepID=A0ABX2EGP0_9BURK|nr:TonB-dependent receptor [Aquabacterium terrae]NRF67793.1 TonB-dependent receptor [Aquabacterium terrae]